MNYARLLYMVRAIRWHRDMDWMFVDLFERPSLCVAHTENTNFRKSPWDYKEP